MLYTQLLSWLFCHWPKSCSATDRKLAQEKRLQANIPLSLPKGKKNDTVMFLQCTGIKHPATWMGCVASFLISGSYYIYIYIYNTKWLPLCNKGSTDCFVKNVVFRLHDDWCSNTSMKPWWQTWSQLDSLNWMFIFNVIYVIHIIHTKLYRCGDQQALHLEVHNGRLFTFGY